MSIKEESDYRNYEIASNQVSDTYRINHKNQTISHVIETIIYSKLTNKKYKMSIWEAINKLDKIIDESDPDLDLPQIVHALQTAENLRQQYPNLDWLHLVGLIHDLGKILLLPEFGSNPQWNVVGDTFPVGCKFSKKIVHYDFFSENPDTLNPIYHTKLGIYLENCGLDEVYLSYGHDEYMYQTLIHNKCIIPDIGLKIIRYHSFYAWHKEGAYEYLESKKDLEVKKWCHIFSVSDLYTKSNQTCDSATGLNIDELREYYQSLIRKYFPNEILEWQILDYNID